MRVRNLVSFGFLFVCGVIAAVTPLRSADDPKANPPEPAAPAEEKTITKIYDVRALTLASDEFGFDASPHSDAFVIPANLPSSHNEGNGAGGNDGGEGRRGLISSELLEKLTTLITATIAPDSWRDNGGTLGAIREMEGMLVVTQTPASHKEIAALLQQLTEARARTVRISADWLVLPPADVDKLLRIGPSARGAGGAPGGEAEHRAMREVDPAAMKNLPASARHFHADLVSRNGQTVHFISGREQTVTVRPVISVGTDVAAYTPVIGNVGDGIAMQVNAAVDRAQHTALVTLFSTFNDGQKPGPPIAVRVAPATQPSSGKRDDISDASATYRELNGIVQEFRSAMRIPLGVPVIVGAMTLEPSAKNAEAQQLVLILRIQAPEDAKPGNPAAEPRAETRIYDIDAWGAPVYDLSLDGSPHSVAFVTPVSIQPEYRDFRSVGQRYPSPYARGVPTREERISDLVKLIVDTVAPETWRDAGGTVGSIREFCGMLVVTHTPEKQHEIAVLLQQLAERKGETVRTSAEWVILSRDEVSKILKSRGPGENESRLPAEIDAAALAKLPATTLRFHADLLCLNGQTVSFISGREKTVTVSQSPVIGMTVTGFQPVVGNSGTGIALQIHPIVDRDRKKAVMTLFSTFNDPDKPGPPIHIRAAAAAATQASSGQHVMVSEASATYRELNGIVQEFRTTVDMALGVPVLVGSMTLEPNSKNAEAKELVLILTVQSAE